MRKCKIKTFLDVFDRQEQFLNKMAKKGYILSDVGKMTYYFDRSYDLQYEYKVIYVADIMEDLDLFRDSYLLYYLSLI